ncbi:MAG: hypothetical protein ACKN9T_18095 [Candidatus Methylumidiphilus sp.]
MTLIALALSLSIAALGVLGLFLPAKLLAVARFFDSRTGLWTAAVLRVVYGMALYQSAHTSLAPKTLIVLGVFIVVMGLLTPLLGPKRLHQILDWYAAQGVVFLRIWAGVALVFGLLVAGAVIT